ncbi:hypothetical protein HD553DRAFT_335527 [Filobasidium floriforme]|uniref:uncharacterized protein n=1 Tax=Filobasidium floriforme TaxID=5210 RepID=UPI001E8E021D|nr:uncharacterized protein HD553DRAFT_335527 [Filobasidium floriforme]KAH8084111.1 hypothetical protein HD553DRAFT_335527 [Filobasidium floriforme]
MSSRRIAPYRARRLEEIHLTEYLDFSSAIRLGHGCCDDGVAHHRPCSRRRGGRNDSFQRREASELKGPLPPSQLSFRSLITLAPVTPSSRIPHASRGTRASDTQTDKCFGFIHRFESPESTRLSFRPFISVPNFGSAPTPSSGSQKKQVKGFEDQGPLRAYACVLRARQQDARNLPPIATRRSDRMRPTTPQHAKKHSRGGSN